MLKNKKEVKGITLVALVITVIILLILAGISIATLTGSGLFEKARLAEQKSKNAQELEEATLKDYQNKIREYINSNRDTTTQSGISYSDQEVKTNNTWFGKPIYTKTVYIASLPNAGQELYPHNIENVEDIWINSGKSYIKTSNAFVTIPNVYVSNIGNRTVADVGTENIRINTYDSDRTVWQAYVTIEYTKTTD